MNDTPAERGNSIWTRLRRRKIVQWGVAYAAGAWALLQVLGFAADAFAWPAIRDHDLRNDRVSRS